MAAISNGLIDLEIQSIVSGSKSDAGEFEYEVWLHTEELDIMAKQLQQVEVLRNYNIYTGDYIVVHFSISGGVFMKDIHPHRDNLEISIIKKYKLGSDKEDVVGRYKFLLQNFTENVVGSELTKMDRTTLDETYMLNIKGQCVLRELEGLRSLNVDGIYKNANLKDLIIAEFSNASEKITLEGNPLDMRMSIVEPDNKYVYKNIIIPTGINLIDLPSYIQTQDYGFYNGAIGTYMQMYKDKPTLFIYPLYNTDRKDDVNKKLLIYHSNDPKYKLSNCTYAIDGDVIKILVGGNISTFDPGDNTLADMGDGIVSNIPEQIMNTTFQITDDKITLDKSSLLRGAIVKERKDGVVKSNYIGAESNLYKYRGRYNRNIMANFQLNWNYNDIDLIYPGMPVTFVYEDEKYGVLELKGSVQGIYNRFSKSQGVNVGIINIMVIKPGIVVEKMASEDTAS